MTPTDTTDMTSPTTAYQNGIFLVFQVACQIFKDYQTHIFHLNPSFLIIVVR